MRYRSDNHTGVVLVHGLYSSGDTWEYFTRLAGSDPELGDFSLIPFTYPSPKVSFSPLRRIPNFNTLADSLQTFLEIDLCDYKSLVLVSHSQGGLIIQRFLAKMVTSGRASELERVRRVIMFACPNEGSELLLIWRRLGLKLWPHAQESELRPINEAVRDSNQIVLERIVYAKHTSVNSMPIPVIAYAGDSDNIVLPASAKGAFPDTGVIPGDHFSIIQPDSMRHTSYLVFKKNLLATRDEKAERSADDNSYQDKNEGEESLSTGDGDESGGAVWDVSLNAVVAGLASAIADPRKIRTLVVQAGLDPAEIDPDGTPYDRWQSVIEQANEKGDTAVDNVLRLALSRSKRADLHEAANSYWRQRHD